VDKEVKLQTYTQATILVVEADKTLRENIGRNLHKDGYRVITAAEGYSAVKLAYTENPNLIVVDFNLSLLSGFEICRAIRKQLTMPILALFEQDNDELDKILALELGADSYLVKPFSLRELSARIRAQLRRLEMNYNQYFAIPAPAKQYFATSVLATATPPPEPTTHEEQILDSEAILPTTLTVGCLAINLAMRRVSCENRVIPMPPKEFELLTFFALYPMQIFSREELLKKVWGFNEYNANRSRTLGVHVYNLRLKLEKDPSNPRLIQTVFGTGYIFNQNEAICNAA